MKKIRIHKKGTTFRYLCIGIGATILFIFSASMLRLDFTKFISRLQNTGTVLSRMMVFDATLIPEIMKEMLVSMSLGITALIIGGAISIVLSCLSASTITPSPILSKAIKMLVTIIRAIPALVWVLMVVASIGFGNTGGLIGLIFPTTGYLTKSFTASLEEEGTSLVEMFYSTGSPWIIMISKGILIQSFPKLLSWCSIRLEANIAEGISLGMVGVAGVGLILSKAISKFDYPMISTTIVVIFVIMFTIEICINRLKIALKSA